MFFLSFSTHHRFYLKMLLIKAEDIISQRQLKAKFIINHSEKVEYTYIYINETATFIKQS